MSRCRLFMISCIAIAVLTCISCQNPSLVTQSRPVMGTLVQIKVFDNASRAEQGIDLAFGRIERVDKLMSGYRADSDISKLNNMPGRGPVSVDPETLAVVDAGLMISELSGGAFDVTIGCLNSLWNFTGDNKALPDAAIIRQKIGLIGWSRIKIDSAAGTIELPVPGMAVDLGGIAKGYAVGQAAMALNRAGCRSFLIDAGGDIMVRGKKNNDPWAIGVEHPRRPGSLLAKIALEEGCVFTSGDYQRYFIDKGIRYHHILDPRTGMPATACQSVTVIGPDPVITDGLSTAVFVLGPEKGKELIDSLENYSAIIIDASGRALVTGECSFIKEFNP